MVVIVAVLGIFIWAIVPTSSDPAPIKLGLDLKGGTHLVMKVNTIDAVRAEVDQAMERIKAEVGKREDLPSPQLARSGEDSFTLTPPAGVPTTEYEKIVSDWLTSFEMNAHQSSIDVRMKPTARAALEDQTVAQAVETIRNRIDAFGVAEQLIARQGAERIVIQLPGVDDPARVKELIRTTAQLQFRLVVGNTASTPEQVMQGLPAGTDKTAVEVLPGDAFDQFHRVSGQQYYAVQKSIPVTGQDLKTARVQKGRLGEPIIGFSLSPEGGRKFGQLTGDNVNRQLAIVLDNRVRSAPVINSRIDNEGIIQGNFTPQEASDLALILRSGSLPASLTTLEERTVGPSLGLDSIRQGVTASLLGFLLVIVGSIIYYKGAGINATVALLMNLVLLLGAMAFIHATLTLPGIAGVILTLAMAIDSNVLVFERIREELRHGKSIRAAIDQGFSMAFGTVIDTNLTTMIAALFLFQFGSGPVRGFAVTLLIGLSASVFTAFFVSKVMFDIVYNRAGSRPERISI